MERDKQVWVGTTPRLGDVDAMTQIAEDARPSERGDSVAFSGSRRCGGDDFDFHLAREEAF